MAKIVNQLPNRISISGHTSASPDGAKPPTDWALSSARADASRQILVRNQQASREALSMLDTVDWELVSEILGPRGSTLPDSVGLALRADAPSTVTGRSGLMTLGGAMLPDLPARQPPAAPASSGETCPPL